MNYIGKLRRRALVALVAALVAGGLFPVPLEAEEPVRDEHRGGLRLRGEVGASFGADEAEALQESFIAVAARCIPATVVVQGLFGVGSGAVISEDGYVLTCAHVVIGARYPSVIFPDGRRFEAVRLGVNFRHDYALLKLEATGLPHFELGDSESLQVRQWVVALGHPGGPYADLMPALTVGCIERVHEQLTVSFLFDYHDAIGSRVPIFGGNSGGPLVDLEGRLLGLNGAGQNLGELCYSVRIREVLDHMELLKQGKLMFGGELVLDPEAPLIRDLYRVYDEFVEWMVEQRQGEGLLGGQQDRMAGLVELWNDVVNGLVEAIRSVVQESRGAWRKRPGLRLEEALELSGRRELAELFSPVAERMASCTVAILDETGARLAYGVVLGPEKRIVTKASLVRPRSRLIVRTASGEQLDATITATAETCDVALLAPGEVCETLVPASLPRESEVAVGQWALTCTPGAETPSVGVVSAFPRGVTVSGSQLFEDAFQRGGLRIIRALLAALVEAGLMKAEERSESETVFDLMEHYMLGTLPRNYAGVIQHDSPLTTGDMGSPLLNWRGELIGLNIGKRFRGTVYAVPLATLRELFPELFGGD